MTYALTASDAIAAAAPLELDTAASLWQRALDSAESSLRAAAGWQGLPSDEVRDRGHALARERAEAAADLGLLARVLHVHPEPWLSSAPLTPAVLGLRPTVEACIFDLDGVLTDSGVVHAEAWAETFDEFLLDVAASTRRLLPPFDRESDYLAYLDGRTRLEGVHAFVASRGLRVPEGRHDDPPTAATAYGLARRKSDAVARVLTRRRVAALPCARRYLETAGHLGLGRAVVSASASTRPMLRLAELGSLVDVLIDAEVMRRENLRSRPAPDVVQTACAGLGVVPERTVAFTHSGPGVVAGRAAGVEVIGVADGPLAGQLGWFGADRVVASLADLLDRRNVQV